MILLTLELGSERIPHGLLRRASIPIKGFDGTSIKDFVVYFNPPL